MKKFLNSEISKYFFYTLLVVVLMVGCRQPNNQVKETIVSNGTDKISIIEVDGCEYILFDGYKAGGLTHKGNCKNH